MFQMFPRKHAGCHFLRSVYLREQDHERHHRRRQGIPRIGGGLKEDSLYLFFWTFVFPCAILVLYMLSYTEPYFMNNKKEDYVLNGTS